MTQLRSVIEGSFRTRKLVYAMRREFASRDARNSKLAASSRVNVRPPPSVCPFLFNRGTLPPVPPTRRPRNQFFRGSRETGIRDGCWKVHVVIGKTPTQIRITVRLVYENNRSTRTLESRDVAWTPCLFCLLNRRSRGSRTQIEHDSLMVSNTRVENSKRGCFFPIVGFRDWKKMLFYEIVGFENVTSHGLL